MARRIRWHWRRGRGRNSNDRGLLATWLNQLPKGQGIPVGPCDRLRFQGHRQRRWRVRAPAGVGRGRRSRGRRRLAVGAGRRPRPGRRATRRRLRGDPGAVAGRARWPAAACPVDVDAADRAVPDRQLKRPTPQSRPDELGAGEPHRGDRGRLREGGCGRGLRPRGLCGDPGVGGRSRSLGHAV